MNQALSKISVIALIFAGEVLAIYAEMMGARNFQIKSAYSLFLKMFLVISIGGGFLIFGYMLGYQSFKNIWIVSAVSITSILIIEPVIAYLVFKQLPTKGAVFGFVLGLMGFFSALFIK